MVPVSCRRARRRGACSTVWRARRRWPIWVAAAALLFVCALAGGGYAAESEAASIASALGIDEGRLDQSLETLSGGQRRRNGSGMPDTGRAVGRRHRPRAAAQLP